MHGPTFRNARSANGGNHLDFWDSTDVRWMAAFDTTEEDITQFVAAMERAVRAPER